MTQWMIIPCLEQIKETLALAERYSCSFEYNDFTLGSVLDDLPLLESLAAQAAHMPAAARSTLHGVFYDITIFSSDPKVRAVSEARVRQSMDVAVRLGVRGVVFHTNYIPTFRAQSYQDEWVATNRRFWHQILDEYPETEVYMENMFDLEPDPLLRLAEGMADHERFGVCLDVAHAHLSEIPAARWIELLAPHIRHVHINDNDGQTDGHLRFGEGTIAFESVFAGLKAHCAKASILIEVSGIDNQQKCFEFLERHSFLK